MIRVELSLIVMVGSLPCTRYLHTQTNVTVPYDCLPKQTTSLLGLFGVAGI